MFRSNDWAAVLWAASASVGAARPAPFAPGPSLHAIEVPAWFKLSFLGLREDVREAARKDKRVMLYFGQDSCPYCKRLMEVNFAQRDIVASMRRHFDAIAMNIWGDRDTVWLDGRARSEKQITAFFKVQFTPTLLFLDEHGRVVARINGLYPPKKFRTVLEDVAQRKECSQGLGEWLAWHAGAPDAGALHGDVLFMRAPLDLAATRRAQARPLAVFLEQAHC